RPLVVLAAGHLQVLEVPPPVQPGRRQQLGQLPRPPHLLPTAPRRRALPRPRVDPEFRPPQPFQVVRQHPQDQVPLPPQRRRQRRTPAEHVRPPVGQEQRNQPAHR